MLAVKIFSLICILSFLTPCKAPGGRSAFSLNPNLKLVLNSTHATVKRGRPIQLNIDIINEGDLVIYVGRFLTMMDTAQSFVQINVKDSKGRISPSQRVRILYPRETIVKWWVPIYGQKRMNYILFIDGSTHSFLGVKGRYELTALYVSMGPYDMAEKPLTVDGHPLSANEIFAGKIESNRTWITVD